MGFSLINVVRILHSNKPRNNNASLSQTLICIVIKNLSITQDEHTWFLQTFMWLLSVIVVNIVSGLFIRNFLKSPI